MAIYLGLDMVLHLENDFGRAPNCYVRKGENGPLACE